MKVNENLKKGIVLIFAANAINLMIGLVNGFVLPKYLSVETYADIKTYQLYVNYIAILAFGYSDGLYLVYGGKRMSDIGSKGINICRTNLILFQALITFIVVAFACFTRNTVLLITAASVIPVNIVATYKNIFQATGEFKTYSRILNYTSILTFLGSMFLLFVVKTDRSDIYIFWNVVVSILIWILMERKLIVEYGCKLQFMSDLKDLVVNIKSGFILMLGNFSSILMTSIDRWFVKVLLTIQDFAYYSFVVSVENLIAIFITPVVTTMYNYICGTSEMESIKKIKRMCLLFSLFLIAGAYPVKWVLEVYLTKYLEAQYVLFILFTTEIFYMLIKGIYVNIYKARKLQKKYLNQMIAVTVVGTVLNVVAYLISQTNEAIALATLVSVIVWYIICCTSVKEIRPDWRENTMLLVAIPVFIWTGCRISAVIGFFVYIGTVLPLSVVLMREDMTSIFSFITDIIKGRIERK